MGMVAPWFDESEVAGGVRKRIASLLEVSIFPSLLALIAATAIPRATIAPWWDGLVECAVFVLAIMWLAEWLLSARKFESQHWLLVPLLALAAYAVIQTLPIWSWIGSNYFAPSREILSVDPFETKRFVLKILAAALTLGMLVSYTSTHRRLQTLLFVIVGVGLVSALGSTLREIWPRMLGSAQEFAPRGIYGQFENRNHFAFLMEMSLGALLGLAAAGGWQARRSLMYVAVALPLCITLVLTYSRGAVFSLMCQLVFFAILFAFASRRRNSHAHPGVGRARRASFFAKTALASCLLTGAAAGVVVVIGGDQLINRLQSVPAEFKVENENPRTKLRRLEIWGATWDMFKTNPAFGIGFGGFASAVPRHNDSSGQWNPQQAHNDYLELLASGGLIAAALAACFVYSIIRYARRRINSGNLFDVATCCGALAGIFAVAVHSLFDFGLHITVNTFVCVALVAIATVKSASRDFRTSRSSVFIEA